MHALSISVSGCIPNRFSIIIVWLKFVAKSCMFPKSTDREEKHAIWAQAVWHLADNLARRWATWERSKKTTSTRSRGSRGSSLRSWVANKKLEISNFRMINQIPESSKYRYNAILPENFTGLVLGCIEAKFCKQILVGKVSPRSTQCTPLHRSLISIFR